jgi:Flp pilus assembly protein TadG
MRHDREKGQAILIVLTAMGIFILGAAGLAIDGAQMYSHRQMAQAAADSAAQAAIMSIFDRTNTVTANAAKFATDSTITCSTSDARTPCVYARNNGFGATSNDTVTIEFPNSAAGVGLSGDDPINLARVTVQRELANGLIRFVGGPATSTIKAIGTAAIVDVVSPTPIIVTHPTLTGALSSNGNPTITICGGPIRSIQVNSSGIYPSLGNGVSMNSNTTVDLSQAGPKGGPTCSGGTGADFGTFAGPASAPFNFLKGTLPGKYIQPASPIIDPFAKVNPPTRPGSEHTGPVGLANGANGCPASPANPCKLYSPGLYSTGISVQNETAIFKPGVYYILSNGFQNQANGLMLMSTGFADDPDTGQGILVYNTGNGNGDTFDVGSNSSASLVGSCDTLTCNTYKGILFFEDRNAGPHIGSGANKAHKFGGGGALSLVGTLYITNTLAGMTTMPTTYQNVLLQGTPGSATSITGEVIAGTLSLGGNSEVKMSLNPAAVLHIRQVALVK